MYLFHSMLMIIHHLKITKSNFVCRLSHQFQTRNMKKNDRKVRNRRENESNKVRQQQQQKKRQNILHENEQLPSTTSITCLHHIMCTTRYFSSCVNVCACERKIFLLLFVLMDIMVWMMHQSIFNLT